MLSTNHHSFRKLNILHKKRSKVDVVVQPKPTIAGNVSLDDLAFLVKRLSVQVDDLVEKKTNSSPVDDIVSPQQRHAPPPPLPQSNHTTATIITRQNSTSKYIQPNKQQQQQQATHTTIDPWASYVPQNYGALLQRLEDIESLQKCPNDCCASTGTVSSADGVPWPQPIEPFRPSSSSSPNDQNLSEFLDIQYTHWCTLMRCLPLMDPITSAHVKTVGLYAMREILKSKASQKREHDHHHYQQQQPKSQVGTNCYTASSINTVPTATTSTRLRDSMSCLSILPEKQHPFVGGGMTASVPTTATQDMPAWMSTSETKTAIETLVVAPIPPPKEENETKTTTTTPTPSGFSSPLLFQHTGKRFQKWVQYKKLQRKTNTDTAPTPMGQSQTLRKIGSWFF